MEIILRNSLRRIKKIFNIIFIVYNNIMKFIFLFFLLLILFIILNKSKKEDFDNKKQYYFINDNEHLLKWFSHLEFLKNDKDIKFLKVRTKKNIKDFFTNLNPEKKYNIYLHLDNDVLYSILDFLIIYTKNNNNIKILFKPIDWWFSRQVMKRRKNLAENYKYFILNFYKNNNFRYIVDIPKERFEKFINAKIKNNTIVNFRTHNVYPSSIIKFNSNPINKIILSGEINKYMYPERFKMKKFKNIFYLNKKTQPHCKNKACENLYSLELNKYICAFASSAHVSYLKECPNYVNKDIRPITKNTHCILLKTYEILGSGSLLLSPLTEKPYLEKIGLIEDKNCMFIDMSDDKKIQDKIDFILDPKNRKFIDKVRKAGQIHGVKELNSKKRYQEFKNILLNL